MPAIYRPTQGKIRILQSEKTSFPILRRLSAALAADAVQEGEFVGVTPSPGQTQMLSRITTNAQAIAQARVALMRVNTTTNDVKESKSISCQKGFYVLQTQLYFNDTATTYAVGDFLTLRFSTKYGFGVLGPVRGGTDTHVIAQVDIPANDPDNGSPMVVTVFGPAQKA